MNSRAETLTLVTLISLVLTATSIIFAIQFVNNLDDKSVDNSALVSESRQKIDELYLEPGTWQKTTLIGTRNLVLYFSTGSGPIYLAHKFAPGTGQSLSDGIINNEHYLRFERPDDCEGKACVCTCQHPQTFWRRDEDEPYLVANALFLTEDKEDKGYSCNNPICEELTRDDVVLFGNGRGGSDEYSEHVEERVDALNEEDTFSPIMMDVILLIQNKVKNDGNFLFSSSCNNPLGDDYNQECQDDEFVNLLTEDYQWEGGVVLGGTGVAQNANDRSDKVLRSTFIDVRLESYEEAPGVIGVCNYPTCNFPEDIERLSASREELRRLLQLQESLPQTLDGHVLYHINTVQPSLQSQQFDPVNYLEKTQAILNMHEDLRINYDVVNEELRMQLQVEGFTTEWKDTPIPHFVYADQVIEINPFAIIEVDLETNRVTLRKESEQGLVTYVSYVLGYNQAQKAIQISDPESVA